MNQRGYPLWLLRDWTAFIAVLITFWTLIFAGFRARRRAARGKRLSDLELQTLFQLYANAESRLDHAIWRQAWRACGYSAKHAAFVQMPAPTKTQELETRFHGYQRALRDMELLVVAYADDLRRRFNLSRAQVGDPNAWRDPLRHVPHATSPGFAGGGLSARCVETSTLGAAAGGGARVLHARDGGGLAFCARGPPTHASMFENQSTYPSDPPRLRTPPRAHNLQLHITRQHSILPPSPPSETQVGSLS